jgi:hypothetical protein
MTAPGMSIYLERSLYLGKGSLWQKGKWGMGVVKQCFILYNNVYIPFERNSL